MKNKTIVFTICSLLLAMIVGVAATFVVTWFNKAPQTNIVSESVFVAAIGLIAVVLVVEIVSIFKINDSTIHTALIAACLMALYTFSSDMLLFFADFGISIPKIVFAIISEVAFTLTAVCCCWYIKFLYGLRPDRKILTVLESLLAVLLAAYILTCFFKHGYIMHFVIVVFTSVMLCSFVYNAQASTSIGSTTYFTVMVFALSVGTQSVNVLVYDECATAVSGFSLTYASLSLAMFLFVYFRFSLRAHKKAAKSIEYQHQAELFESKALSGQIKPHFIFNSLEAVRALYHQDIAVGDEALNHLSNFLRGCIHSFDSDLIPFETEIDNIFSYTEFENLKRKEKTDIIFNIDFSEFYVPPFSIQPFVENALKYSGVDQIENGSIIISSYKSDNCAVVEIVDNGKGFDLSKVSENSHGIKNASGRFALTLGVVPEIESEIGIGTRVKIVIDLDKQGERSK